MAPSSHSHVEVFLHADPLELRKTLPTPETTTQSSILLRGWTSAARSFFSLTLIGRQSSTLLKVQWPLMI